MIHGGSFGSERLLAVLIALCAFIGERTAIDLTLAANAAEASNIQYIGTATMREDESIELRLYSTSNGTDAHFYQILHKGDALYDEVIAHVGGLKPGESKLVPPWPDDSGARPKP